MRPEPLEPVTGSWVISRSGEAREQRPGVVRRTMRSSSGVQLTVHWIAERKDEVIPLSRIECGLRPGYGVWHVPDSKHQPSLGMGVVIAARLLGGRQQLLVDFASRGRRLWIPWERLRFAKGPEFRFRHGDRGGADAPERFRLRNLAQALTLWNENTGSLSHFDIDPLPHQIHLVHHILSSGNLNWLIADDVGLGKTIEAGLLIAALRQRGVANRVLIVVPAGLTRQWQEDLKLKFGLDDFLIYGSNFQISDNAHWKLYDHVIASMDKLKGENHLERILAAEPWDLVIFDEAHRLTRRQWGLKFEKSYRYRLAEALRERSTNLLLLTATPHQGRSDQFAALLQLLRPELMDELEQLEVDSSVLSQLVFRNRKSDVTDIDGNFVFVGQTSKMIQVDTTSELRELERQLRSYLEQGYSAASNTGGIQGKAIGFVMTVYRKLAASSIVTLQKALVRRLARLKSIDTNEAARDIGLDERYAGEWDESQPSPREEFFAGEVGRLETLIEMCAVASEDDYKMQAFLEKIIASILQNNPDERVLVFTEYRGTQDYIVQELARRYGAHKVHIVNGSMDVDERLLSISQFETDGQFLISTEAGGEGINLHRRCHILVNFDLPWNPMRLAQRIGRLYRYGQKEHVLAFNLQGLQSADELIVSKMYERIEQVARDMSNVDDSTSETLVSDIVGELAGLVDVEDILEDARTAGVDRTANRIEEALQRARESSDMQKELFQHAVSYDANELQGAFQVDLEHLRAFVFGMIQWQGGEVRESRQYPGKAWRLILTEDVTRTVPGLVRDPLVTFDRRLLAGTDKLTLLDMDHPLVRQLIALATHYDFEGFTAAIALPAFTSIVSGMLRWQDDQGKRLRQEYVVVAAGNAGLMSTNPPEFARWLLSPASPSNAVSNATPADEVRVGADREMDRSLASKVTRHLHPEGREWLSAACCGETEAGSG